MVRSTVGDIKAAAAGNASPASGVATIKQILLGTPEAAEATEQIGKFLRTRVP